MSIYFIKVVWAGFAACLSDCRTKLCCWYVCLAACSAFACPSCRRVVAALRAKGVPCRALVRDRARAANLLPQPSPAAAAGSSSGSSGAPEFEVITGDVYQYATLPGALKGCNAGERSNPWGMKWGACTSTMHVAAALALLLLGCDSLHSARHLLLVVALHACGQYSRV